MGPVSDPRLRYYNLLHPVLLFVFFAVEIRGGVRIPSSSLGNRILNIRCWTNLQGHKPSLYDSIC